MHGTVLSHHVDIEKAAHSVRLFWDLGVSTQMPLRRLFKCYAFHAYAKMSAHEFLTADIFAYACAVRLQILPCGRSGEICSEREP